MANLITVQLQRGQGQPWGFRLQGGKDFSAPLVLQRVNGGSVADQAGLMPGDALVKVNSTEVFNLRHKEAQDVIMAAGNSFELTVSRGTAWRPSVTPTGSIPSPSPSLPGNITPVTKTSLAATPQPVQHIGSGHNQAAKPFPAQQQPQQPQQQSQEQVNGNDPIKSIVNKQYNTPVAMYSDETIAETLSSQAEVLAGGVLGVNFKKNERVYSPANSEVYKLLHEQGDNPEPASSHFYATQSHAIGGYATAGRLPVGSLTKPRSPVPPQMLQQQPRPVAAPKMPAPAPAPMAAPAPRPAPQVNPRAGIPPRIHPDGGQKTGVQAISAALNAHANLNGRSQSPYAANNQNNITPKPFGAAPSPLVQPPSSFPPVTGSVPTPFSAAITGQAPAPAPAPAAAAPQPASYPPVQAPAPAPVQAPAPAPAPAAVAPAAPAAVPTPQAPTFQKKSPAKQTPPFAPGAATTLLDSSVSKLAAINGNSDYRKQASNVLKEMLEARLKKHEATPNAQQQQEQVRLKNKENLLSNGGDTLPKRLLNPAHPMSRIIDMCDSAVPAPPPLPKATLPFQQPHKDLKPQPVTPNTNNTAHVNSVVLRPKNNNNSTNGLNGNGGLEETLAQLANRRKVSSELTSHARDRRSYVEKNNNNSQTTIEEESVKKTAEETATPLAMVNKVPICNKCNTKITTGPFITALGRIWCPDHFICHNANCKRPLADIGFVEEKGDLYCEYCFEEFLAPVCSKCNTRVKGDCLNAIGKQFHPECFKCTYCGKLFGNSPFFLEEGDPYCETDWNELFTTKCFACGFPVEAGDKWVEALNNNYHSQCFNCTSCKKNLEGQSFFAKGGRPFCKNHAR